VSGLRALLREVRRRSFWSVLAVYLAGSWIAFEVVSGLTEAVGLPEWFPAFAIGLLVLGLPVVLATAMVQEGPGTPAGPGASEGGMVGLAAADGSAIAPGPPSRAPSASDPDAGPAHGLSGVFTWRNAALGGVAAVTLWALLATGWILLGGDSGGGGPPDRGGAAEASIAALPLVSLGADEDAWFADGIHEEILTQLHKIGALRVISRTSVMGYRETDKNLREIAGELGVRYVLEGSVQRFGERVKVTAQLIDAESDAHVWAENYERPRADLFAIQTDVATKIASALRAELSPEERERLAEAPTRDPEAHDLYLRGLAQMRRASSGGDADRDATFRLAVDMFRRAAELDPAFAAAWARLGLAHIELFWFGHDRTDARRQAAAEAVRTALAADPESGEAYLAQAYVDYHGYRAYDRALAAAARAEERLKRNPEVLELRAFVLRRQGHYARATAILEDVLAADPRNPRLLVNLAGSYQAAHRWDDVDRTLGVLAEIAPLSARPYADRARAILLRAGDAAAASDALAAWPGSLETSESALRAGIAVALARRDFSRAHELIVHLPVLTTGQEALIPRAGQRGAVHRYAGRREEATRSYQEALGALDAVEHQFSSEDPRPPAARALILAGLGRRAEALDAAAEARTRLPVSLDAWAGAFLVEVEAEVLTLLGEADAAIDRLAWLVRPAVGPVGVTAEALRIEPRWDALRGNPRFEALVRGEGPEDPPAPPPFASAQAGA
jgi:TolB-like protein